jgi:hypothetical protein
MSSLEELMKVCPNINHGKLHRKIKFKIANYLANSVVRGRRKTINSSKTIQGYKEN